MRNKNKFTYDESDFTDEVQNWLCEETTGEYFVGTFCIWFHKKSDAAMFKLVFIQ